MSPLQGPTQGLFYDLRHVSATVRAAGRVSERKDDIWSIVNAAASQSPFDPMVNLGQGFLAVQGCGRYWQPRFSSDFGRQLDAESEILVTTGANEGFLSAIMAYIEPGDEVVVIEPHFDQFVRNINMAGGIPKFISLKPPSQATSYSTSAADWVLDLDELERIVTNKTRMLILNTPHNPTGKLFSRSEILAIGNFCKAHSMLLLSDEVYFRLSFFDGQDSNAAETRFTHPRTLFPELTLTIGSAGKDFAATGWRVGFVIGSPELLAPVARAHSHICFAAPSAAQEAMATGYELAD
ncbi:hypothetical protein G7Y89_g13301 [Cudoniella acicularis]|uniref:Aminotransferase class I/classII large domain-containing protein n=1 Tax=Cudoniella acicularis TaxID=354080 RepID=A0A8H4R9V0_9HELO|nr:hypothetical protein G7Y89_g13301 [Cudoniella acicularis]